jgi:hypothetical protein
LYQGTRKLVCAFSHIAEDKTREGGITRDFNKRGSRESCLTNPLQRLPRPRKRRRSVLTLLRQCAPLAKGLYHRSKRAQAIFWLSLAIFCLRAFSGCFSFSVFLSTRWESIWRRRVPHFGLWLFKLGHYPGSGSAPLACS